MHVLTERLEKLEHWLAIRAMEQNRFPCNQLFHQRPEFILEIVCIPERMSMVVCDAEPVDAQTLVRRIVWQLFRHVRFTPSIAESIASAINDVIYFMRVITTCFIRCLQSTDKYSSAVVQFLLTVKLCTTSNTRPSQSTSWCSSPSVCIHTRTTCDNISP